MVTCCELGLNADVALNVFVDDFAYKLLNEGLVLQTEADLKALVGLNFLQNMVFDSFPCVELLVVQER